MNQTQIKSHSNMRLLSFFYGTEENLPESMEIIEAICKECMVEINSKKFDKAESEKSVSVY